MWWTSKSWHRQWLRDRGRGIWLPPRHCTSGRWAKNGLALHFHKLALKLSSKRGWRHLPVDDRIAAALLGLAIAIHRFDPAAHVKVRLWPKANRRSPKAGPNGLAAYAVWWMQKELQRLAANERRGPQEDHKPYGFEDFGPETPVSFRRRVYPLIRYDENAYRRRAQYVTVDGGLVENIKLGAPADNNDDVEHVGTSFAIWSPINPETNLLFKEAAWEKYNGRSAEEIAQMLRDDKEIKLARSEGRYCCDASPVIDAAAVNAARRDWRARKNKPHRPEPTPASLIDHAEMAFLPASVFAPV
jgi:hypothetical protein